MNTYVIIGSSAAGYAAATTLSRLDPDATIHVVSKSLHMPYNTCLLASVLSGERTRQDILLNQENNTINWILGRAVTSIDRTLKRVMLDDGSHLAYHALLIATGSQARRWPKPLTLQGVFYFQTIDDCLAIDAFIEKRAVKRAVVVGAGLTGLECADALIARGIEVTLLDSASCLVGSLLNKKASQWLEDALVRPGLCTILNDALVDAHGLENTLHSVVLQSGRVVQTDMLIFALGSVGATKLVAHDALEFFDDEYETDECMNIDDPWIYAAGDCALVTDNITQKKVRSTLWADAYMQGVTAAYAMAGRPKKYPGLVKNMSSHFLGVHLRAYGSIDPQQLQILQEEEHTFLAASTSERVIQGVVCLAKKEIDFAHSMHLVQQRVSLDAFGS